LTTIFAALAWQFDIEVTMTQLGKDIIDSLADTVQMTLVPAACKPRLTITHADGSVETRELADVAIMPIADMPPDVDEVIELSEPKP
jgi:hypothetical protein